MEKINKIGIKNKEKKKRNINYRFEYKCFKLYLIVNILK